MERQRGTHRGFFAVAGVVLAIVTAALFSLPEFLVELMRRNAVLDGNQADWAYRFLAVAAVAQVLYGGFVILTPARIGSALRTDQRPAGDRARLTTSVARIAAVMICLTFVYGVAAFALTGQRAGFWLFVAVAVAQCAWYYRAVGDIDKWLELQSAPPPTSAGGLPASKGDPYCPPLARALIDAQENAP